ncbi:MAG: invasion associated locus B family protein [Pseudomonadota bacterium]
MLNSGPAFPRPVLATLLTVLSLWLISGAALAQSAEFRETHRDWFTFQMVEEGATVCFMATRPTQSRGNYSRRGEIALFVTHRPGKNSWSVVSIHTGYTYQSGSTVVARVGGKAYSFFTAGEVAFANSDDDLALIEELKAGADMIVEGTSSRGTLTTDTFSLRGFSAAYDQISASCGTGPTG